MRDERPVPGDGSTDTPDDDVAASTDDGAWDLERLPGPRALAPWRSPPAPGVVYAEIPVRALAFFIDLMVVQVAVHLVGPPVRGFVATVLGDQFPLGTGPDIGVLLLAVVPEVIVIWALSLAIAVYSWTVFRATPGQMVLGLFTLTAPHGGTLSVRSALVRWAFLFAPMVFLSTLGTVLFGVSEVAAAWGLDPRLAQLVVASVAPVWYAVLAVSAANERRGRGLHDRAAGTVVVRRAGSPS